MRLSFGNLGGTIMFRNTPVLNFKFYRGALKVLTPLVPHESKLLPPEFYLMKNSEALYSFLEDQVTPCTRIGIDEELKKTPIQYYNPERMLRYSHGISVENRYWISQDDDISCWEGSPLEGIGIKPETDYYNLEWVKCLPPNSMIL